MKNSALLAATLCLAFSALLPGPAAMGAEYSGSYYFGECDGDGAIQLGDIDALKLAIIGGAYSCPGNPTGDWQCQDMDGDWAPQLGDLDVLKAWLVGFSASAAVAYTIENPVGPLYLAPGMTAPLTVQVYDNPATGADAFKTPRACWGVIFEVDTTMGCSLVELYGRDPSPEFTDPKDNFITDKKVFNYTGPMAEGAKATVILTNVNCGGTIYINTRVPGDLEAMVPDPYKFPDELIGPTIVIENQMCLGPCE